MSKYWKICMEDAMSEAGISFTEAQLCEMAKSAQHAAEMEYEATGQEHIPHPLEAELASANRRADQERKAKEKVTSDFKNNIAMRRNCDVSQITLEGDGHATVWQ